MVNAAQCTKMASRSFPFGGPAAGGGGRFNDADMLQVGTVGLSQDEQSSHFSLWAIMASPLLIGADVTLLSDAALSMYVLLLEYPYTRTLSDDPCTHDAALSACVLLCRYLSLQDWLSCTWYL
jgi:hypothetical protein